MLTLLFNTEKIGVFFFSNSLLGLQLARDAERKQNKGEIVFLFLISVIYLSGRLYLVIANTKDFLILFYFLEEVISHGEPQSNLININGLLLPFLQLWRQSGAGTPALLPPFVDVSGK